MTQEPEYANLIGKRRKGTVTHIYCSICQTDIRITEGTDDEVQVAP